MARLIIPEDFASQKKLFEAIAAENQNQGTDSVLNAYLAENGINIKNPAPANAAQTFDDSRQVLVKQSTNYTQLRNLTFDPIVAHLKSEVQFLKTFYKTNTRQLGEWGITVVGDSKITYPASFADLAQVATLFFDKHLSYAGNTSPLQAFVTKNSINVQADRDGIDTAIGYHNNSIRTLAEAENATEQRNLIWLPILENIRSIGNFLMKLYPDNPRALGAWGFTIDQAATKPKEVVTKIKLSDKTTLKGVVIGGTLKNIGSVDVHVYKGSSTTGNPIIIHPAESYGIAKGFSTITVSNPSTTTEAKVSVLRVN